MEKILSTAVPVRAKPSQIATLLQQYRRKVASGHQHLTQASAHAEAAVKKSEAIARSKAQTEAAAKLQAVTQAANAATTGSAAGQPSTLPSTTAQKRQIGVMSSVDNSLQPPVKRQRTTQ